jgi:hypothetical protein
VSRINFGASVLPVSTLNFAAATHVPDLNTGGEAGEVRHDAHFWNVYIGGKIEAEGSATVLSVTRSLGMRHVDQAVVQIERAAQSSPFLQGAQIRPVEIGQTLHIVDDVTGAAKFWGIIEDAEFFFGEAMDQKRVVATIQPHHFGEPLTNSQFVQMVLLAPGAYIHRRTTTDDPIVFNGFNDPERHLTVPGSAFGFVGNRTLGTYTAMDRNGKDLPVKCPMFIPLDAVQSPAGISRYDTVYAPYSHLGQWTLRDAVRYLCAVGNTRGLIQNPSERDIALLPDVVLYRTELPVGITLPEALDRLLGQYGWYWYVEPNPGGGGGGGGGGGPFALQAAATAQAAAALGNAIGGGGGTTKPQLKFVRRGVGPTFNATHGPPGTSATFSNTNVRNFRARYSIAPAVNEVHVLGGLPIVEGTFELQNVGGKWVLNEGGKYDATETAPFRPADDPKHGSKEAIVPNLSDLFPPGIFSALGEEVAMGQIQRNRRFLPCINLIGAEGQSEAVDLRPRGPQNGVEIEIIDRNQEEEETPQWIALARHPFRHKINVRLADDECAVIFDDGHTPESRSNEEFDAYFAWLKENGRVRITAAIESDVRVQVRVKRDNNGAAPSVQPKPVVFAWDAPDRFPIRQILITGPYASKFGWTNYRSETPSIARTMAQMREFGRELLKGADQATISGQIELMHCDYDVPLGGVVPKIAGRNLELLATHSRDPRYPQIVAIHHDLQSNSTTLTLSAEPDNLLDAFA